MLIRLVQSAASAAILSLGASAAFSETADHFFDQPYKCTFVGEIIGKLSGKVRKIDHLNVYFPEKMLRVELWDRSDPQGYESALLFAPKMRYDGFYRVDSQTGQIVELEFMTAWVRDGHPADITDRRDYDSDESQCAALNADEIALFTIEKLDAIEVMN